MPDLQLCNFATLQLCNSVTLQPATCNPMNAQDFRDQSIALSILTACPADRLKEFVETLLPRFPNVEVMQSRTGLAMLPYVDSAKGVTFHLGETLLAEAQVTVAGTQGYAACLGRDLEQAIAIAILDALLQSPEVAAQAEQPAILAFVAAAAQAQQQAESELLRKVESTRVELETF